jgi:protein-L-isoaspartate O-methyltransferase
MALLDALYALVIFLSAILLFLVEPMTAKRLLPALGGSAAVWTTCLVFFQTTLMAGYFYAHLLAGRLRPRAQAMTHTTLLALAVLGLSVQAHPDAAGASWHPLLTTLWLLTGLIGLPFLALAATTPLLQSWYARSGGRIAPAWRLFALSNLGALLALAAYPALIETHLTLRTQQLAWDAAFAVFAVTCAGIAWQHQACSEPVKATPGQTSPGVESQAISMRSLSLWILLPAASSLMLCAITSHLSQNIAAIPLLWIVPLAIYLLSFIVTFAGPRWYARSYALRMLALTIATLGYLLQDRRLSLPLLVSIPVYAGALFVFCYFCHGELYRLRPAAGQATSYYLLMSLGSALGAIFAGVAAPMLFRANYDLLCGLIFLVSLAIAATWDLGMLVRLFWFAATVGMVWAAFLSERSLNRDTIAQLRSFYGCLRVTQTFAEPEPAIVRKLLHGTIEHGIQIFSDELRTLPTSYYAPDSGAGLAVRLCCNGRPRRVGVVGLGVGTMAAYGQPGDTITFYEIDPLVERLARARFTYLRESRAAVNVVIGDARLQLEQQSPQGYDVLVLDAFSGDAIPVHLLTAQAIELYRRHLRPNGILAFHISSQYVDMAPVLAAEARQDGLQAYDVRSPANDALGAFQSDWVLLSADPGFFRQPEVAAVARPLEMRPGQPVWTDDFNSLLPLVKWTGLQTMTQGGRSGN